MSVLYNIFRSCLLLVRYYFLIRFLFCFITFFLEALLSILSFILLFNLFFICIFMPASFSFSLLFIYFSNHRLCLIIFLILSCTRINNNRMGMMECYSYLILFYFIHPWFLSLLLLFLFKSGKVHQSLPKLNLFIFLNFTAIKCLGKKFTCEIIYELILVK